MELREIRDNEIELLQDFLYEAISFRMYEKVGFRTVDENDEEFIMVCEL